MYTGVKILYCVVMYGSMWMAPSANHLR